MHTARMPRVLLGPGEKASACIMPFQPFPEDAAGRELRRTLAPDEQVLAYALGLGGALVVATDWRAIIIKVGAATTGTWFGKQNTTFRYGEISRIDLSVPTPGEGDGEGTDGRDGARVGFVVITSRGEQYRWRDRSRPRDPAHFCTAKNVCPFDPLRAASFGQVVEIIRRHVYTPPR